MQRIGLFAQNYKIESDKSPFYTHSLGVLVGDASKECSEEGCPVLFEDLIETRNGAGQEVQDCYGWWASSGMVKPHITYLKEIANDKPVPHSVFTHHTLETPPNMGTQSFFWHGHVAINTYKTEDKNDPSKFKIVSLPKDQHLLILLKDTNTMMGKMTDSKVIRLLPESKESGGL